MDGKEIYDPSQHIIYTTYRRKNQTQWFKITDSGYTVVDTPEEYEMADTVCYKKIS